MSEQRLVLSLTANELRESPACLLEKLRAVSSSKGYLTVSWKNKEIAHIYPLNAEGQYNNGQVPPPRKIRSQELRGRLARVYKGEAKEPVSIVNLSRRSLQRAKEFNIAGVGILSQTTRRMATAVEESEVIAVLVPIPAFQSSG